MDRPLVVTDPNDRSPELIREAGKLAEDTDSPLLVLTIVSQEEFEKDAEVLTAISDIEGTNYERGAAGYAKKVANSAVSDLLFEFDIETETIGREVDSDDERSNVILEVARENKCNYIFLIGRRRRPTGKVIFGDTAQDVILNFNDYVVTLSE